MEKKKKIKKRICFIVAIVFIIIALLIPFVFAMPSDNQTMENNFFSVDSLTKTAGSTLEMKINLETIDYSDFKFTLTNGNKTLENIDTSNLNENTEIEKANNSIVISGNKEEMNVNEIKLYYQIPGDLKIGTTLTFQATIEENQKETFEDDDVSDVVGEDSLNQAAKQTIEITVTIVEETNTSNENSVSNKDNQNGTLSSNNKENQNGNSMNIENNKQDNKENSQGIEKNNSLVGNTSSIKVGTSSNLQSETVTYNGSSNNYLEELSVKGYEFENTFRKENITYFMKLDEDITSLGITAKAEDDEAKICIYGNEDIKDGSKILISVTAENGNVRIYRIYVSK